MRLHLINVNQIAPALYRASRLFGALETEPLPIVLTRELCSTGAPTLGRLLARGLPVGLYANEVCSYRN
jgi:hypothetical protein